MRTSILLYLWMPMVGIVHTNLGALILREPSVHKLGRDSQVRYVTRRVVRIYLQRPTLL